MGLPDFAAIHEQLRSHQHVTLQLLWEEYRQANPDAYRYLRGQSGLLDCPFFREPRRNEQLSCTIHLPVNEVTRSP